MLERFAKILQLVNAILEHSQEKQDEKIDNMGFVSVNGETVVEPYITDRALGECDIEFPFEVPEQRIFVLGDQRNTSIDSRSSQIGCINEEAIIGKVWLTVWPPEHLELM